MNPKLEASAVWYHSQRRGLGGELIEGFERVMCKEIGRSKEGSPKVALSHGKCAIHEPTEMGEDNKDLFRHILRDFVTTFQFTLPEIEEPTPTATPAPTSTMVQTP